MDFKGQKAKASVYLVTAPLRSPAENCVFPSNFTTIVAALFTCRLSFDNLEFHKLKIKIKIKIDKIETENTRAKRVVNLTFLCRDPEAEAAGIQMPCSANDSKTARHYRANG